MFYFRSLSIYSVSFLTALIRLYSPSPLYLLIAAFLRSISSLSDYIYYFSFVFSLLNSRLFSLNYLRDYCALIYSRFSFLFLFLVEESDDRFDSIICSSSLYFSFKFLMIYFFRSIYCLIAANYFS